MEDNLLAQHCGVIMFPVSPLHWLFPGAYSSLGLQHLAQGWSHTVLNTCVLKVLSGHQSPGHCQGRQKTWVEECVFQACYLLPFIGLYSLHVFLPGLSSSGHMDHARFMDDKEVSPYHQKALIVGHVALSEAAYSRHSLYT